MAPAGPPTPPTGRLPVALPEEPSGGDVRRIRRDSAMAAEGTRRRWANVPRPDHRRRTARSISECSSDDFVAVAGDVPEPGGTEFRGHAVTGRKDPSCEPTAEDSGRGRTRWA